MSWILRKESNQIGMSAKKSMLGTDRSCLEMGHLRTKEVFVRVLSQIKDVKCMALSEHQR